MGFWVLDGLLVFAMKDNWTSRVVGSKVVLVPYHAGLVVRSGCIMGFTVWPLCVRRCRAYDGSLLLVYTSGVSSRCRACLQQAKYHGWMKDEWLRDMTASEELSLDEEYKMQEECVGVLCLAVVDFVLSSWFLKLSLSCGGRLFIPCDAVYRRFPPQVAPRPQEGNVYCV